MSIDCKDVNFSMDLANEIKTKEFPLTIEMIYKNRYDATYRIKKAYRNDSKMPSAVVIYRDFYNEENAITKRRIYSFEVAVSERGRGIGHRMIKELMWDAEELSLGYLQDAKQFYLKEGFCESGENEMTWRSPDLEAIR